jgi:hypothetical protein
MLAQQAEQAGNEGMNEVEIRAHVHELAERMTQISTELSVLSRRAEFERDLRTRDYWTLVDGKTPDWVLKWNEHFEKLAANPDYVRLQTEWTETRARLHSPGFDEALERMKTGDASGAEYAIAYLEADPFYFRSGYLKSTIARRLRRIELTETQVRRIQDALLAVTSKGGGDEVVEMRPLARRVETHEFRARLRALATAGETGVARRATLMLRFCEMNDTPGRDLRGAR